MIDKHLWQAIRPVRSKFLLSVALNLLNGILVVGQAYALTQIINGVFLDGKLLADVTGWLAALTAFTLARFGAMYFAGILAAQVALFAKRRTREELFQHLAALGPTYLGGERSGELANTMIAGIEALDDYLRDYLPHMFSALLIPLAIVFVVFPLDPLSGVVLILTAPLLVVFMVLIGLWAAAANQRQWASLSLMSAHFLDVLQGLTTLKLFNRTEHQNKAIERISDDFRVSTMRVLRIAFLSSFALELITSLSIAIIAVEIGLRLLNDGMAFDEAFFILVLAPEFYQPLRNLGASYHAAQSGKDAVERIFSVLAVQPAVVAVESPAACPLAPYKITFDDVSFTYPNRERPAVQHISFHMPRGTSLALVGASGGGKSTLAALLMRFIDPQSGLIRVNDTPLKDIHPGEWQQQIAWVPQRPYLFQGTILDNIRMARPEASWDEVQWAAEQAFVDDVVEQLPAGWDTDIGESGKNLSGGQAQRIAIARAFLKDAPLLVWDEATAHLDPLYEEKIRQSISKLMANRTTLMIAHRLTTVRQADQIIVLEASRVIEIGTHDSLRSQNGRYQALVTAYG